MTDPFVLWNGGLVRAGDVRISPFDRGLLLGDGAFETMRADDGHVHRLVPHGTRLTSTLSRLRIAQPDLHGIEERITSLLAVNHLTEGAVRLRWTVTRGVAPGAGMPFGGEPTELITAERHHTPSDEAYTRGWRLSAPSHIMQHDASALKSTSYLPHLMARQTVIDEGCDDAILVDASGEVSECTSAALLVRFGKTWYQPASVAQLDSITRRTVISLLDDDGIRVESRTITPEDLSEADAAWVSNALIGVMPVGRIGHRDLPSRDAGHAAALRGRLFEVR